MSITSTPIKTFSLLLILTFWGCFHHPSEEVIYQTQYQLNLGDLGEASSIDIDSVRINVSSESFDSTYFFLKVRTTDDIVISYKIPEDEQVLVEYWVYFEGVILKYGSTAYHSGNFDKSLKDSLDHFEIDSIALDSIKAILALKLKVDFENSDTLVFNEADEDVQLNIIIPETGTTAILEDSCKVKIQGHKAAAPDLFIDTSITFPPGATIGHSIPINLSLVNDSLIEVNEEFVFEVIPQCESREMRATTQEKVMIIEDDDKVNIKLLPGATTAIESDTIYEFLYLVEFTHPEDSLTFGFEVLASPQTTLNSDDYNLKANVIKLNYRTQHGDTLRFKVNLNRDNLIQESQDPALFVLNTSVDSSHIVSISQQSNFQLYNNDFSYYFITDTISNSLIILDHEFNYIGSKSFGSEKLFDVDTHQGDTVRISTGDRSYFWVPSDDYSYTNEAYAGYQLETPRSETQPTHNLKVWMETPVDSTPQYEDIANPGVISAYDLNEFNGSSPIWLNQNPQDDLAEVHYFDTNSYQLRITGISSNPGDPLLLDSLISIPSNIDSSTYLGGVFTDTLGVRYYTINEVLKNNEEVQSHVAIIKVLDDLTSQDVLNQNSFLGLGDYAIWPLKNPGPITLNLQGDLVTLDPIEKNMVKLDANSGSIISVVSLSQLNVFGAWDMLEYQSTVPIDFVVD